MPKMKTRKSAAKRLKLTATGRLMHKKCGLSHLLSKKTRKRKRQLKRGGEITGRFKAHIERLLPYGEV